jgi:DNA-binding NtrC family response regulator
MNPRSGYIRIKTICDFFLGRNPGEYGNLIKQAEVDVKRELDSLVTQMHSSGVRYEDAVREFKKQYLREVLLAHRGNQCKAAEELGMHRNTLSRTMAELGLSLTEVRAGLKRPPRSERPVFSAVRQAFGRG